MLEHNFTCCRNNLAEQRIRTPDLLHTGCGSLPLRYMDMCADEWLGFSYPREATLFVPDPVPTQKTLLGGLADTEND